MNRYPRKYLAKSLILLSVLGVLVQYVSIHGNFILNGVAIVSALIIGTVFIERWGKQN